MRIVTRGDLDGLACAVLIASSEGIDDILLVHPQELTEGEVEIREGDNLVEFFAEAALDQSEIDFAASE